MRSSTVNGTRRQLLKGAATWALLAASGVAVAAAKRSAARTQFGAGPILWQRPRAWMGEHFVLLDPFRRPLADTPYRLWLPSGETIEGVSDARGATRLALAACPAILAVRHGTGNPVLA